MATSCDYHILVNEDEPGEMEHGTAIQVEINENKGFTDSHLNYTQVASATDSEANEKPLKFAFNENDSLKHSMMEQEQDLTSNTKLRKRKVDTFTMKTKQHCAVFMHDVNYNYGKLCALENVSSTIIRGEIYGLLGPSGCGKTTFLRCIVGVTKPKSGEIMVFGEKPGSKQSSIPGPGVGYMPQDIALHNEFTIQEIFDYYGQIYGMSKDARKKRLEFLIKFLEIPSSDRQIETFSGGQKRRASLAVALIHSPPLLILDEPTVGADPLLRQSIWNHLVELTQTENITIILTTHYVEEARLADKVGLMRHGRMLVESNPNVLLEKFDATSLEMVFLKVGEISKYAPETFEDRRKLCLVVDEEEMFSVCDPIQKRFKTGSYSNQIEALMKKQTLKLRRNMLELAFQIILPALQIILFCICIGEGPHGLKVAVHNPDRNYSIRFLNEIDTSYITLVNYASIDDALNAVKQGQAKAAISFDPNFSKYVRRRFQLFAEITNETLSKGKVKYYSDITDFPSHLTIMMQLVKATIAFVKKLFKETPLEFADTSSLEVNIAKTFYDANKAGLKIDKDAITESFIEEVQPPIYGTDKPSIRDYGAPGLMIGSTYMLAVANTVLVFILDRKGGQLERTLIAGVHPVQILIAHFVTQIVLIFVQNVLMFFCGSVFFSIPVKGSIILAIALNLFQGIAGMSFGILLSSICKEVQAALFLAVASFFQNLIFSGIFWPLEAMPDWIRHISYLMAQTMSVEALRSVLLRGWGFGYIQVWLGFVSSSAWIMIYVITAMISFLYNN